MPSTFCLLALLLFIAPAFAEDAVVSKNGLEVRFLEKERFIVVTDLESGPILERGAVTLVQDGTLLSTRDRSLVCETDVDEGGGRLTLRIADAAVCRITISDSGSLIVTTECRSRGTATFAASAPSGEPALLAMVQQERETDRRVLRTALGPAEFRDARSLFFPERDLAVTADSKSSTRWRWKDGWSLTARASTGSELLSLEPRRHYYRDTLGIQFYEPFHPRGSWTTPPVVAMTWYGIEGWKGKPAQREEWLLPQIDWVAKHLLPYAGRLVFQLDDNYLFNDDACMRGLSDTIRSRGLIPGIWFTPYGVADNDTAAEHPDWFLHDREGRLLKAFGGVNFGDPGSSATAILNTRSPEAMEACFAAFWRKASETWNYDFFKIDGQPQVAAQYRKAVDGGGAAGYRRGLEIGRTVVGEEKFINGCWGTPLDAIGLVDGSRTGGDTGNHPHAIDVIVRWNFLNNICWWCDPDAAANLFRSDTGRIRLNAQARVLTGQQFLTDDVWTEVGPECRRVWQRSFPSLAVRPVNLYPIESWQEYDLFDLRIAAPWGTRDVVGLFNFHDRRSLKELDLERLSLESEQVHLYEYWTSRYLGRVDARSKIVRYLAPLDGQLFSIVPASPDRPDLVSTSRHLSQGGLDLEDVGWEQEKGTWIAKGRSSHLVKGDPYDLVFATGRYRAADVLVSNGSARVVSSGPATAVRFDPDQDGEIEWRVAFRPITGTAFSIETAAHDLAPGKEADLVIVSRGTAGFEWNARLSDSRISVVPDRGSLGPWPDSASITVRIDLSGLAPGTEWTGRINVETENDPALRRTARLRSFAPTPENLALGATASASSIWGSGYEAARINDSDSRSRWNSRKGEKAGAWIELAWPEAVTFDRIVIDECIDFGPRIESWRVEAVNGEKTILARGKKIGRHFIVDLEEPAAARRVRLVIEKASEVPTIHEIELFRWRDEAGPGN